MNDREMACQELVEAVTDYLEDRMSPVDRDRFERHLSQCRGCENFVQQMRLTIVMAGRLTERSIPPGARSELLRAFRDWRSA